MDWIAFLAMKVRASLILTIDRSLLNILQNMFLFGFGAVFSVKKMGVLELKVETFGSGQITLRFPVSLGLSSENVILNDLHLFLSLMLSCTDEKLSSSAF